MAEGWPQTGANRGSANDDHGAIVAQPSPAPPNRSAALLLLAAVDISQGKAVRPVGGMVAAVPPAATEPMRVVSEFVAAGATWIHLVDLDQAYRRGNNTGLLAEIVAELAHSGPGVRVQLSGGIADQPSLAAALATGAAWVNLGAAALSDVDWCVSVVAEHGERVAVGLDVAGGLLRPRGGGRPVGAVMSMLDRLNRAGVARYVVTDVARDGRMAGPNLDLLVRVCASTEAAVLASGGVATLDDLRALCALAGHGLTGVIVGQALHVGAFTVAEALHALQPVATA